MACDMHVKADDAVESRGSMHIPGPTIASQHQPEH